MRKTTRKLAAAATSIALITGGVTAAPPAGAQEADLEAFTTAAQALVSIVAIGISVYSWIEWYNFLVNHGTIQGAPVPGVPTILA